jgi:hypothetical protein
MLASCDVWLHGRRAMQKQDGKPTKPARAVDVGVASRSGGAGAGAARIGTVGCLYDKRRGCLIRRCRVSGQMSRPITAPSAPSLAGIPNTQATGDGQARACCQFGLYAPRRRYWQSSADTPPPRNAVRSIGWRSS